MASTSIRNDVLQFLSARRVKHGESVEYGWFIFQTVIENAQLDLETLDFKKVASFTRDFEVVERIHGQQMQVLKKWLAAPSMCTLRHAALISRSYLPGAPKAFIERLDELEQSKSGWYVGVADDPLDVNNSSNLTFQSLYELSIHDPRFTPYWLLPRGYRVEFNGTKASVSRD